MSSRYDRLAPYYDLVSGERLIYRRGRHAAVDLLDLSPGMRVLVPGCGTGLDLPYLAERVGAGGEIVGVDLSRPMLRRAQRRAHRLGLHNTRLVPGDAALLAGIDGPFDAVLFSYSLGVIDGWRRAWTAATALLAPGGRVAVVDTDRPEGPWWWHHLAETALAGGGVRPERRVWTLPETLADASSKSHLRGHIRIGAGTWR